MKVLIRKEDLKKATSDINGKFWLPWEWDELKYLEIMWPDNTPVEIEIPSQQVAMP